MNTVILDRGMKPYFVAFRETFCFEKNKEEYNNCKRETLHCFKYLSQDRCLLRCLIVEVSRLLLTVEKFLPFI